MGILQVGMSRFGGKIGPPGHYSQNLMFFNTARKISFLSINTAVSRKDIGNPQRTWNSPNSRETIILFGLSVNFEIHLYSEIPQC